MSRLFVGSAICEIGAKGMITLPTAFCIAITSRKANDRLFICLRNTSKHLVVHDESAIEARMERFQRRRLAEGGLLRAEYMIDLRRDLGFTAPGWLNGKGQIAIAPWLNLRHGEAHRALVVGMGDSFEIWDLDQIMAGKHDELRLLASLHLDLAAAGRSTGTDNESSLRSVRPRHRTNVAGKPRLPVHAVHPLLPRHDSIIDGG
ncbi:hypothetical protein AB5I39_13170 [Sphingomonas sp. MMS24-J45]|uniref:hypothetical protein n=1 Tax=Sphingomonas sp. MMS24-J45 TaxID=3238806 RepID=UPI00384D84C0